MLIESKVKITHKNIKKLISLGYSGEKGDIIKVDNDIAKDFFMVIYKKKCKICDTIYETKNYNSNYCSRKCSAKNQWTDDFKEKMKDFYKLESQIETRKNAAKKSWNSKRKNNQSEKMKDFWTEDKKEKRSEEMLARWEDNDFKDKMKLCNKEAQSRPETIKANIKRGIDRWKNPEFVSKQMKKMYKFKDYELPSGKIIKLQGYEPQVLTNLLDIYDECDIIIGRKNISKIIGDIEYYLNGVKHTYFPDFYILSENKIIEVKSTYTYDLHIEKNKAKEKSCLERGLKFEFIIL